MKVEVLVFHPNLAHSRVNRRLIQGLDKDDTLSVRDMYALYPNFKIDVAAEQSVLEKADRIVLQFPMYWYSSPALLKQWLDDVLIYGWAYGSTGNALKNKELLIAVSPGAKAENYQLNEGFGYRVTDLLRPFQATSQLIKTNYLKPFITVGASTISEEDLDKQQENYYHYLKDATIETLGQHS